LDWHSFRQALVSANYGWVLAAVLAILATFFTRAWRWQALLWQSAPHFRPTLTAMLLGQIANMALPMRSGDVVRASCISPENDTGTLEALTSIAIEKVWDLLALLACGLILLIWIPLPEWFTRPAWGTALILVLGGGVLLAALNWQDPLLNLAGNLLSHLPAGWDAALLSRLRRLAISLKVIRRADVSLKVALWTGLTWALGYLANWAILTAFDMPSAIAALFLHATLMLGSAVPTPGNLGVFEGICVLVLARFFYLASDNQALATGLVLHLVVIGPPMITTAVLMLCPSFHAGHNYE
jgi:hypothetical protein